MEPKACVLVTNGQERWTLAGTRGLAMRAFRWLSGLVPPGPWQAHPDTAKEAGTTRDHYQIPQGLYPVLRTPLIDSESLPSCR